MFLIPKSNFKKFDPERSCFVLNEFAAAEFSSAIEMLFAAKVVKNKNLSNGFIRHALDEYKHCFIFTNIKNQMISEYKINKKELNFIPHHIYNKGYVYKDHFIFEKKKLNDFAIFIGANEEIAEKKLINFANYIKKVNKPAFNEIQNILQDEARHSEYSLSFAKKYNGYFVYKCKITKERIMSHFRHFYANGVNKLSFIFYPILIIILIFISLISNFLKLKKKSKTKDIMNNIEPNSIV